MKQELAAFAVTTLRSEGFSGRGVTLRVIGEGLQWVARVEKVGHVDQVNVEVGIVFHSRPLMKRNDCRVLWSLPDFVGVESDEVARALLPAADCTLEERKQLVGEAIVVMSRFVHAHRSIDQVKQAYADGQLAKAFVFKDARKLLEST